MSTKRRRLAVIFCSVAVILLLGLSNGIKPIRRGGVYGACRVLDGEIPYRDFWIPYAPGYYYFVAWLFWPG